MHNMSCKRQKIEKKNPVNRHQQGDKGGNNQSLKKLFKKQDHETVAQDQYRWWKLWNSGPRFNIDGSSMRHVRWLIEEHQ